MPTYLLAFYEQSKAYGGPEEGGWWCETGELVRISRTFPSKDAAQSAARKVNGLLRRLQRHLRPISSVAYTGGRYVAHVPENIAPIHYPETRPYYE